MTEAVVIQKIKSKSMDWFLYDNGLRHEKLKIFRFSLKFLLVKYTLLLIVAHHFDFITQEI